MTSERLLETLKEETCRAFEQLKVSAEKALKETAEEANRQMNTVVEGARGACNELAKKCREKEVKKEVQSVIKGCSETVDTIEKESIKALNDSWSITKSKLQEILESTRESLGTFAKDLEKSFKEVVKFIEKIIAQCVKMIREFAKTAHKQLKDVGQCPVK